MYHIHPDFPPRKPVTGEQLQAALDAPVLQTAGIPGPLVIASIRMVRAHGFTFVITRTADGRRGSPSQRELAVLPPHPFAKNRTLLGRDGRP